MPHPNAVLPCPSESARRRHAAHGQTCTVCDGDNPTTGQTPAPPRPPNRQEATSAAL